MSVRDSSKLRKKEQEIIKINTTVNLCVKEASLFLGICNNFLK